MGVDAEAVAKEALAIAAREIRRLAAKESLSGFDIQDLGALFKIAHTYDQAEKAWVQKLDPSKFTSQQLERLLGEEADGTKRPRGQRRAAG